MSNHQTLNESSIRSSKNVSHIYKYRWPSCGGKLLMILVLIYILSKYPWIVFSNILMIFLSRISSLKREMKKITLIECNLDLLTLSLSYVFYETLVLKSAVNKVNRKVCAGACLILAAKLNDVKGTALSGLIDVRSIWGISNQYYNSFY